MGNDRGSPDFGTLVFRSIDDEKQARVNALGGESVELHPREFNLSVYHTYQEVRERSLSTAGCGAVPRMSEMHELYNWRFGKVL